MRKIGNLLLVVFFALLMLVPLLTSDFRGGSISETENRVLASAPTFRDEGGKLSPSALINSTEAWIKDNVGGRKLASDVWTQTQYHLFKRSTRANDIIGQDEWIYYAPDYVLADYTGDNLLNQEQLDYYPTQAAELDRLLKARGIQVRWMLIPDKKTAYAEYYPEGIHSQPGINRTNQILEGVSAKTEAQLIDMRAILQQHKTSGQLYYAKVDDSHWNLHGSYYGVEEICRAFGVDYVKPEDCEWAEVTENKLFNGAVYVEESYLSAVTGRENTYTVDEAFFDQFPKMRFSDSPETFRWHTIHEDSSLPSLLVVGDSYFTMMRYHLAENFGSVTFMHLTDTESFAEMLEAAQPDCVVFECVERMLQYMPSMIVSALVSLHQEAELP